MISLSSSAFVGSSLLLQLLLIAQTIGATQAKSLPLEDAILYGVSFYGSCRKLNDCGQLD